MIKNKRNLFIAVIILTASLLAGCGGFGNTPTEAPVVDNQPNINTFDTISASGEVIPYKWVSLGFPSGGQNLNIYVNPGDIIEPKRLLAEVDHVSANAALENAKAALANAKATLDRLEDLDAPNLDIEAAESAIKAAEASVEQAMSALESTYLYAPFGGSVVEVNGRNGENAPLGQPVIMLADLNTLQVETTGLSEVDVVHVKVGNAAEVSFDAFPDITTTGRVAKIALSKSTGSGVYYKLTITMDDIPEDLRWGMSAFVVVSVGEIVTTSTPTMTSTITPTITPTWTPTPNTTLYKAIVLTGNGDGVNLRDAPDGKIIEVLWEGTRLIVLAEDETSDGTEWVKVRTDDDDELEGWIVKEAAATLTPTPTYGPTITPFIPPIPDFSDFEGPPPTEPPVEPTDVPTDVPTDPPTDVPTDPPTDVPTDPSP
ncbi:efflux RND transporter periplasmic adaptor subunit [Chloroflexota bacterium]